MKALDLLHVPVKVQRHRIRQLLHAGGILVWALLSMLKARQEQFFDNPKVFQEYVHVVRLGQRPPVDLIGRQLFEIVFEVMPIRFAHLNRQLNGLIHVSLSSVKNRHEPFRYHVGANGSRLSLIPCQAPGAFLRVAAWPTCGGRVADEWLPLMARSMGGLRCGRKQGKMRVDGEPFAVAALENHRGTPRAWERRAIRMESG